MISQIKQKRYKLVTPSLETAFFSRIEADNKSIFPALRDAVEHNPVLLQRNQSLLLDHMEQQGRMIMGIGSIDKLMILQQRCGLGFFEDPTWVGSGLDLSFKRSHPG